MKTTPTKQENKKTNNPFSGFNAKNGFIKPQAKLNKSVPGDKYEEEADAVAEKVVGSENESSDFFLPHYSTLGSQVNSIAGSVSPFVQKQDDEEEELLQAKSVEDEEDVMMKADGNSVDYDTSVEQFIQDKKGSGKPLDPNIKSEMEQGFGADFSGVKIHNDNESAQANQKIGAHAFTTGNDIFFNDGKYRPNSESGKKLIAHELTHTLQQGASSKVQNGTPVQGFWWDQIADQFREMQKMIFRSRNYGPITYSRSDISGSGFEASYNPMASVLNVTVRGKIRFADTLSGSGGTFSSSNHFMNTGGFIPIMNALPAEVQAKILPYFQWTETQKQIHMVRFRANLEAATSLWQDTGMSLQVNETGWEDVTAVPNINLSITEGDATHQTTDSGATDESSSDHIQIEIVKQPTADEAAEIQRIITEHNAATGATVNSGMIQGVRSYLGNDPGSRGSAPAGFNNFMSLESDRSDDPSSRIYSTSVYFENNESGLSDESRAQLDSFFSDPMILLDNAENAIDIDLSGYASAVGSTSYNSSLVDQRIAAVSSYIDEKISSSNLNTSIYSSTIVNDSDQSAETDLAANPATYDPASFRRVDIMITREGRGGQNVFAHELGHVFGLGDEYAETANGYNRPAGSQSSHHQLAIDAGVSGGALVADDNRMMSTGNEVGAAHYSTFADALRQLTSKPWKVVTS
ncbi:MAG: DUF4157 domain-containing protein [Prolixibacteraceae bacterium]|nr:DUF4157 domain-containing protein [Prolixibacteraceae bacterium]